MSSTPGANLDNSIENLQRFNALITETVARLQADQQTFGTHAAALDRLEDSAGQQVSGLGDGLETHAAALDAAADGADTALEHLEEMATAAADTRLAAADEALDSRGQALEDELSAQGSEVDGKSSDLTSGGFAPAIADLSEAESAVQSDQSDVEKALEDLEAAVQAARDSARSAAEDVTAAVGEFGAEASAQQATAGEVGQLAAYATETFGPELEAAVDAYLDSVDEAYADVGEAVLQASSDDLSEVASLLGDAAQRLENETLTGLEDAIEETAGTSLERLLDELGQAEAALGPAAETAEGAGTLIPDLATSQSVIAEIDSLLNTLES